MAANAAIESTILFIIKKAQLQGLQIQYNTVISTAFAWGMGHGVYIGRTPNSPGYQGRTIGDVIDSYNSLVSQGLIPPGTVN